MLVSNLTVEQLQDLIRHTVEQCLEEYFGDPDADLNVKPEVKQKLQEIIQSQPLENQEVAEELIKS
ncbi:MAG TPA: hypothetical protein DCQ51_14755 [Planktothrix sp. UBA8407]|jgi:hypothetical protein|nr:hypothetical protein [Planktothrix sp. UBA8407]HBK25030.1 hypothetical protein [Planktothrix sp. UBA10369]